jgi:hypothetical protein
MTALPSISLDGGRSMKSPIRSAIGLAVLAAFLSIPGAANAFEVFLDYNTDDDITTFQNLVVGPVTVPIDVIVSVDPSDTVIHALISWEYGDANPEGFSCADFYGSVSYEPFVQLPSEFPFVAVTPFSCVCFTAPCPCDAELVIEAYVVGLTEPGTFKLATLDFSREGANQDCGTTVWPAATFTTGSSAPEGTLVITAEGVTGSDEPIASRTWGRVKTMYR